MPVQKERVCTWKRDLMHFCNYKKHTVALTGFIYDIGKNEHLELLVSPTPGRVGSSSTY